MNDRDTFIADQSKISEEEFLSIYRAVENENLQFKEHLDKTHNKLTSDVSEYIFASEDPLSRIKKFQKTLNDLEKVCVMDRLMVGLIEKR